MIYDRSDYLSKAEYAKMSKVPDGCTKLMGTAYTKAEVFGEGSLFAAQFGISHGMSTTLYSYDVPICDYCANILLLDTHAFEYSRTTCRHLSEFLKRYTHIDYQTLKSEVSRCDYKLGEFIDVDGTTVMFV